MFIHVQNLLIMKLFWQFFYENINTRSKDNIVQKRCQYIIHLRWYSIPFYCEVFKISDNFINNIFLPTLWVNNQVFKMILILICRNLPFILLTRPLDIEGFPAKAPILAKYLTALITGNAEEHLDINELITSIKAWKGAELEMLCEMSMDSMYKLFSEFQNYDTRWNEVFMMPPTDDLIQLKVTACDFSY